MDGWRLRDPAEPATVALIRARQGAGRPEPGTAGVGFGAAADFLRRQHALAAERRAARHEDGDSE